MKNLETENSLFYNPSEPRRRRRVVSEPNMQEVERSYAENTQKIL